MFPISGLRRDLEDHLLNENNFVERSNFSQTAGKYWEQFILTQEFLRTEWVQIEISYVGKIEEERNECNCRFLG